MIITTILGDSREVELIFDDGSYICPFCGYPTKDNCNNPACQASRHWTKENLTKYLEKIELQEKEEEKNRKLMELRNKSYGKF
jgi:hypothetical protein